MFGVKRIFGLIRRIRERRARRISEHRAVNLAAKLARTGALQGGRLTGSPLARAEK